MRPANWSMRYSGLLDVQELAASEAVVVGVGAIGRQVALQAAAMGFGRLVLVDPDVVAEVNVGAQGYPPTEVGQAKVVSLHNLFMSWYGESLMGVPYQTVGEKYFESDEPGSEDRHRIVFVCVDSMGARRRIWGAVDGRFGLYVDARMAAEACSVFSVEPNVTDSGLYAGTLGDEGVQHEACTARSTMYCANVAAGLMLHRWAAWMRGMGTTPEGFLVGLNPVPYVLRQAGTWTRTTEGGE